MDSAKYWKLRDVKERHNLLLKSIKETEDLLAIEYRRMAKQLIAYMKEIYEEMLANPDTLHSHLYQYNKYYEMVANLEKELHKLGVKEIKYLDHNFKLMYKRNLHILGKQFGTTTIDTKIMELIINAYWVGDGLNWSGRIWRDKKALALKIVQGLNDTIITGRNPDALVKTLMLDFGLTYNNAKRIVETELCRILTQSTLLRYKDAGLSLYRFLTARDEKVCPTCDDLDNQIFDIDKAECGSNAPPMHPFCRCCILGVININSQETKNENS